MPKDSVVIWRHFRLTPEVYRQYGASDVDKITGLSPVISIEQKTVNKNPRFHSWHYNRGLRLLRLLYARASDAYSYETGELMRKFSENRL